MRSSTSASSTDSPDFQVRSMTLPFMRFRTRHRVNDCPLPGFTNWCSTTWYGTPSIWILSPLRMSVVLAMAWVRGVARRRAAQAARPAGVPAREAFGARRTAVLELRAHGAEVDEELREIKREIIESRGLVIKTNNLTNALSADIKSIAKRQQRLRAAHLLEQRHGVHRVRPRRLHRAEVRLGRARRPAQGRDASSSAGERAPPQGRARTPKRRRRPRERAERGRARSSTSSCGRESAPSSSSSTRRSRRSRSARRRRPCSPTRWSARRNELAAQLYQQGLDKARVQRWQEAATAFEESLKYKEDSAIAPSVRLGARRRVPAPGPAEGRDPHPHAARGEPPDKEVQDDALYLLAWCQMDIQAWNEAKNTWRTLIGASPIRASRPKRSCSSRSCS